MTVNLRELYGPIMDPDKDIRKVPISPGPSGSPPPTTGATSKSPTPQPSPPPSTGGGSTNVPSPQPSPPPTTGATSKSPTPQPSPPPTVNLRELYGPIMDPDKDIRKVPISPGPSGFPPPAMDVRPTVTTNYPPQQNWGDYGGMMGTAYNTYQNINNISSQLLQQSQAMIQQVWDIASKMPELAAQYGKSLMDAIEYMYYKALSDPKFLQSTMNQLSAAGIMNSSLAADIMSQVISNALSEMSQKAYEAKSAGLQSQLGTASTMATIGLQLGDLAGRSGQSYVQNLATGQGIINDVTNLANAIEHQRFTAYNDVLRTLAQMALLGQTSVSGSLGGGSSHSSDPLAPYYLLFQLLNMMS